MNISGKYYLIENDPRFPLTITGQWQNFAAVSQFTTPSDTYIYALSGNGNLYVGSSEQETRPRYHRWALSKGKHRNSYMQRTATKYGFDVFHFQPVAIIPPELVCYRDLIENSYIKLFDSYHNGFNQMEFADTPTLGFKHSEESKAKMSARMKGRAAWNKGREHPPETRRRISAAIKGIKHTVETRRKVSEAGKGRVFAEEHKRRISEATKRRWERLKQNQ